MSFNSSSSSNASLLSPHLSSSNSSLYLSPAFCLKFRLSFFIFVSFSVTNILLLLPLYTLIIYLGLQRWWRRRSSSRAAAASHSDVFTYHLVAVEMIGIFGCGLYCCGACANVPLLMTIGTCFFSVTSTGQILFHILTCVERHLAVVHPITYLGLRQRGGVRMRNVTIGCTWLLFFGSFGLTTASNYSIVPLFCITVVSTLVVSFCSLSVLRALTRPGPGDAGRVKVDQSKLRAFRTIAAIMGALLLRFGGHLVVLAVYASTAVSDSVRCGVLMSGVWFCLHSSLVLPLLFLHRAGKLSCCGSNSDSDQGSE